MNFKELMLIPPLLKAVAGAGYTQPSPIQQKAIPPVLQGRDLLGCAQTGSGKTAAFALPVLQRLAAAPAPEKKRPIRVLVLTPTRELALQIQESFELYGKHLPLRSAVIFGGVGQAPQVAALKKGVDILVATPGRLNDLIGQGYIKLNELEIFVLDEADRMLDMGFIHDVKKVLRLLPAKRQTLLFSATMPDEIVALAAGLLHSPAQVFVTPSSTTVETVRQLVYKVDKANKRRLLASLLQQPDIVSALVFTRTKHGADRVVKELAREKIPAMAIHGNKSQGARQAALGRFKDGNIQVLVATDIAARGLDIQELSHVFNYDLPNIPETYVHRIGRTGRAGHSGTAISFCCADELEYLADIQKTIGFAIPEEVNHPWPMQAPPQAPAQGKNAKGRPQNPRQEQGVKKQPKAPRAAKPAPPLAKQPEVQNMPLPKGAARGKKPGGPKGGAVKPDVYSDVSGSRAIVTRRPVWGDSAPAGQPAAKPAAPLVKAPLKTGAQEPLNKEKGDTTMSRNNRRRGRRGRGNTDNPSGAQAQKPAIPKNENGIFDFSEKELAEDSALRVISRSSDGEKFASFEDFLKKQ